MTQPFARAVDLFDWASIDDARAEVERAETARNAAERRFRYAPVGTKKERLSAYLAATQRALEAEGQLRRMMREAGQ